MIKLMVSIKLMVLLFCVCVHIIHIQEGQDRAGDGHIMIQSKVINLILCLVVHSTLNQKDTIIIMVVNVDLAVSKVIQLDSIYKSITPLINHQW